MSKNNFDERLRKMEPRKDHYSIRKFSVGVASVLIGFSFLGLGNTREVKAGTIDQPQAVETKKSIADEQKQTVQDNQNKANQGSLSTDNESQKVLTGVQAAAIQSMKNRQAVAIARKSNKSLEVSDSTGKLNSDIGLTGRKDTDSESQNAEKQSDRKSVTADKKTDTSKTNKAKSSVASSSVDSKKSSDDDYQIDAQSLNTLTANKTESDKSSKTDQANELAKELNASAVVEKNGNLSKLTLKGVNNDNKLASGTEQTLDINKNAGLDVNKQKNAKDSKKLARLFGNILDEETPTKVYDATSLEDAINNQHVHDIQFVRDIQLNNDNDLNKGSITTNDVGRELTIDGQNHKLDFGNNYISFTGNKGWNITFKDLTVAAASPSDTLISTKGQVNFEGTNNITETNLSGSHNVIEAANVNFNTDSNTKFTVNGNMNTTESIKGDVIRATSNGNKAVNIASDATVDIESQSSDLRGIVAGAIQAKVNEHQDGEVYIAGQLIENLSNGHSSAIWAGSLNINGGNVYITTKQDNQADGKEDGWVNGDTNYNGYHYAPISLGTGAVANTYKSNPSLTIINAGSLKLVRTIKNKYDNKTLTPLIAFGSGGNNGGSTQILTVGKGSTLDLQDNSASFASGHNERSPRNGLITMFGNWATNTVIFDNPAYINLQRTGSTTRGTLLKLEGDKSGNSNDMQIVVKGTTPIAEWDEANFQPGPSFVWHIKNLQTQNGTGDDADKFVKKGHNIKDAFYSNLFTTNGYIDSNSSVSMADNETGLLNQFENNFNWWTEQRIAIGSKLDTDNALKNHAQYKGTTIKQGDTGTISAPLINNDPNDSNDVSNYAAGEGIQSWAKVNHDGTITLTPTTSNTTANTMYSIPVLVTYKNNTSETVYAPVYVTKDDNHHVTWGKDSNGKATGAIVVVTDPNGIKAHETSGNSQVLNPSDAVSEIDQYKADDNGKETANGTIDKSKANISWNGTAPTTKVDSPSINGNSLSGSIKIDLSTVNGIDSILGNDSTTITQSITFTAVGAAVKNGNPSVDVVRDQQPTSDQLAQLVDHSKLDGLPDGMAVVKYELKPGTTLDTSTKGKKSVSIRILFKDKDAQGNQTYLDLPAISNGINVVDSDADTYDAHYQGTTIKQGSTGTIAKPSITKKADGSVAPNTVTETYKRTSDTPSWVTVKNDGSLSLAPTIKNSTTGMYNIPVLVTYNDNSSETVYAPVYVTNDDNHHVIWGKDGRSAVIVVTQPVTLHETSNNSMVTTTFANQVVNGFDIYTKDTSNSDKVNTTVDSYTYKNGEYQDAAGHNLGSITVAWASDPTTTVTTPSLNASISPQLKITFNADSAPVVDGIFDSDETDTITATLSLMGATEKNNNPSVDVIRGEQPTSDQLATLIDHSKLDGLTDDMAVVKYELKPGTSVDTSTKGKKSVTIRILFKDKDAQGNPTYLDLPAITDGINVVNNDSDTYGAHYQGTTVKQGETGTVAIPSISKKSDGSVAPNTVTEIYKRTSDTQSWVTVNSTGSLSLAPTTDNSTVGMYNVPVLVTYNDNSTETVYAPVYVTKDDAHHVTWGKDGHSAVVTVTQPVTLHQTSDSSMVTTDYAGQTVKEFDVYTKDVANPDRISIAAHAYTFKDGQYQDADGQKLGSITVTWNGDPSTVVTTPSLTNSKTAEIKITFGAGSVPVSDGIFDADKSDTANASLDLRGATDKTGYTPVDVVRGQQPTSAQLAQLVDHSKLDDLPDGIKVDGYELVGTLDTSTTGKKDVTIRIVFKDKNGSGKETYLDLPAITNGINVITSDADKYVPSYSSTTLRPGQSVSVNPSWKDSKTPTGESFALVAGDNTPTWVTINSSNGKITFAPTADINDSAYRVPVKVTYQDGSSVTVYAPVYVTDGQHTATWGEGMTTMYEGPVATYHKTTNGNDFDIKNSRLVNIYNWDEDNKETIWTLTSTPEGDYYIESKGNQVGTNRFKASDITYTWITNLKGVSEPSTNVDAFGGDTGSLLYLNSDGTVNKKEQTGPDEDLYGNSKWRYHFTIGGDAPSDIDVPAGMWANIYFNFLGATGKQHIPVNVGDTVPTDANGIKQYLQSTDVIKPPAVSGPSYGAIHKDWTVTNISWETHGTNGKPGSNGKFDANNLNGTVRLDFKNANGGSSYLDVKVSFKTGSYVPHNNNNDNKNDDTNLYVTRTIHYDVPAGETAVPDIVQSVHYIRDGHHKIDAQGNDLPDIIWNAWKLADDQTAKFPEIKTVNQFTGYDSYVNKVKGKRVASADVTEDEGTPQNGKEVTITYVKQNATPIKYDPNSTDDNMTVHRHITYDVSGTGHNAIDSVDQTVDYVRKDADGNAGYKDPVTGKITYVAWTVKNGGNASFPEINPVVQITGYDSYVGGTKTTTLASADIAEDKDGKPQNADNITITYKASDQSVKFEFWDDTDNKEIGSDHTVKGTTNQTVTTNLTAPANYDLAKGNDSETDLYSIPANYKFGATNPAVIKIHFVHGTETITHDKPSTTIKGAEASDLTTKVTRKVTINTPATDGQTAKPDVKNQEVDFGRNVKVDKVTGKIISYSDWQVISSNSTLAEVDAPTVAGYTPTSSKADEITPKAGDKVADVTINYNPNDQHIDYQFVDDDNNGSNVGSAIEVDGKTDGTVDPSKKVSVPAGYKLADGQSIPTSYKFKASGNDTVEIHLVHGTKTVQPSETPNQGTKVPGDNGHKTPGDGKPKNDINYTDLHKDITRTITDYIPGQAVPTVTPQKVSYQRTATIDDVTGDVTYGDWKVNPTSKEKSLAEYDVKAVSGYTPSITKVDAETPTSYQVQNWTDPNIVIKYTAGDQSMTYTFVDDDNHGTTVGSPVTITGNTNQNVPTGLIVPDGYKLAERQTLPTSYTFKSTNPGVDIHLKHVISPVIKPGNEPKPGDKIPDTKKTYPDDATKDKNFEHDVTRTVTINIPNSTPQVTVQPVHFTRTATVDAVTGKISYTDWTSDNTTFGEIDAPVENGYVADKAKADKVTGVKESDPDSTVTINYKKVGSYVPVDDKGNQIPGTSKTPYTNDPHDPTKVENTVPDIPGYKPTNGKTQTPSDPTKDTKVTYTANGLHVDYQFVDDNENGATVGSPIEVDGKANGTVDPSQKVKVPSSYELAEGQTIPTSYTFGSTSPKDAVKIHLIHGTKSVSPTDPGVDPTDSKYSDLFKTAHRKIYETKPGESQQLIDTQTVQFGRSGTEDLVTGKITASGSWVAGQIEGHRFVAGGGSNFASENIASQSGYSTYVAYGNAARQEANTVKQESALNDKNIPTDADPVYITFESNKAGDINYSQNIVYVYKPDNTTISTASDAITGSFKSGSSATVTAKFQKAAIESHMPTNWVIDQDYPNKDETINSANPAPIRIYVKHATKEIKPNDPGVDPKNSQYSDMFTTVKRDIEVTDPGQTTPVDHQQLVKLERSEFIDLVTNKVVSYGKWQLAGTEIHVGGIETYSESPLEFPEWAVPQYDGYTSYVGSAPSKEVKAALIEFDAQGYPENGKQVNVTYQKITNGGGSQGGNNQPTPQGQIIIKYVDPNGKTVNTVTVPVAKGSTTDPSGAIKSNVPKGYKLPDGYTAPTSASEGATISVSIVPINHKKPTSGGNKHKPTHNKGGKLSRKGKSRQTNAPKHNAKSGSNSAPLSERGPRGLSGHNLAALEAEKGIGQNGVKTVKISGQNSSHNANTLPQTGENDHRAKIMSTIGFLGLTAAGIIALLTLGGDRKRK